jgi:hypothetical protein
MAPGVYRARTKIVRIVPRFVLVNRLEAPLQVRQCDTGGYAIHTLAAAAAATTTTPAVEAAKAVADHADGKIDGSQPAGVEGMQQEPPHQKLPADVSAALGIPAGVEAALTFDTMPFHWADDRMSAVVRFRVLVPTAHSDDAQSLLRRQRRNKKKKSQKQRPVNGNDENEDDEDDEDAVDGARLLSERAIARQSVWLWSGYIEINHAGDTMVRLRHRRPGHPARFVQVEVRCCFLASLLKEICDFLKTNGKFAFSAFLTFELHCVLGSLALIVALSLSLSLYVG